MKSAEQILAELYRMVLEANAAKDKACGAAVDADKAAQSKPTPETIMAATLADIAYHKAFDAVGEAEKRYGRARTAFLKGEDITAHDPSPVYVGNVHNATPADSRVLEAIAGGPVEMAVMNTPLVKGGCGRDDYTPEPRDIDKFHRDATPGSR